MFLVSVQVQLKSMKTYENCFLLSFGFLKAVVGFLIACRSSRSSSICSFVLLVGFLVLFFAILFDFMDMLGPTAESLRILPFAAVFLQH